MSSSSSLSLSSSATKYTRRRIHAITIAYLLYISTVNSFEAVNRKGFSTLPVDPFSPWSGSRLKRSEYHTCSIQTKSSLKSILSIDMSSPCWKLSMSGASSSYFTDDSTESTTTTTHSPAVEDDQEKNRRDNHNSNDSDGILVSAAISLPFSADVAFDAFQDPIRQPTWSSWLRSVEYVDPVNSPNVTRWTVGVAGFSFSWNAKHTKRDRTSHTIEWQSASGLRNRGIVQFVPIPSPSTPTPSSSTASMSSLDGNNIESGLDFFEDKTQMTLTMIVSLPKTVMRLLGGGKGAKRQQVLQSFIQDKMLRPTLSGFRKIVWEQDVPEFEKKRSH